MIKRLFLTTLLSILSAAMLVAQSTSVGFPSISNFSRTTYQAGTQNWSIQQDQRGILYFGNNKGILEFDGTNWNTYPLPNGTIVRSLALSENGRLYVGGQDEFGYLEADERGRNIYHSLTYLVPTAFQSFDDIWNIFIRPEGIYFCSKKAIFLLEGEAIQVIPPINQRFENFFDLGEQLIVQDWEAGLFRLEGNQLSPWLNERILRNERVSGILPYTAGQWIIFTFSQGSFVFDSKGLQPWEVPANRFLQKHQAYCATELSDGRYAIGTPQNGVLIMDRQGTIKMHLNSEVGLQNNTVLSITQDLQRNLWLGLDNGIDYAEIHSPFSIIQIEGSTAGTGYASIIHDNKLYLGTNQGLFCAKWEENAAYPNVQRFEPVRNGLGQIWSLNKVRDQIIVGQHKGASYLTDNQLKPLSNIQGGWKFVELQSKPGFALAGTYSGFYLYEDKNRGQEKDAPEWQLVGMLKGFEESARVFEEDEVGNIWVSHAYKGLYRLTPNLTSQSFVEVELFSSSNGLPGNLYINVAKIRNELVFTTPSGVFQYDRAQNQFNRHTDFSKIFGPDRNIHRLIEDELGNIWFSVDNEFGVLKVEEKGVFNQFQVFYFNQVQEELVDGFEHVYAHDERNVIIGTKKGFVYYRPLADKNTSFPFQILIREVTSITEGDSTLYWGNATNTVEKPFVFDYAMNDFRFTFSVPYYEKISSLTYRYMLEGFEDDWSDWSFKTEKEYTNLPAGDYAFKVQAKNAYGQISDSTVYPFEINPPWYLSWVARIAYLILGILGIIGLIQYVSKREEKKTEAFKKAQEEKLEQKEAEFKKEVEKSENEIIKLRNEKLHSDIKHKNSQLASTTMHLVQKSEMMMKIKNDLKQVEAEAPTDLKRKIQQITRTIESDTQLDENWEQFEVYFDQVHENFFKRLRAKFPELTPKDQKLCAYLRMNLTTKEIAPLLNISVRGVEISRYRLRKKLNLSSEVNLVSFILEV